MMRYLFLAFLMMVPFSSANAQEIDCAKRKMIAANTVLYCAEKDFEEADRELNYMWRSINKLTKMQKEYSAAILESQRAWIKFRDTQCNAVILYYDDQRTRDIEYVDCKIRMTKKRTIQIRLFGDQ